MNHRPSHRHLRRPSPWRIIAFASAASLLGSVSTGCSVHEHELTPYGKEGGANTGGASGAGDGVGGAAGAGVGGGAGAMQGGAAGTAGMFDGSAGSAGAPPPDAAHPTIDAPTADGPTADALADTGAPGDGAPCLPDCPPTTCGTISNNCGATLSCGPCQLSSTFASVPVALATPRYAATAVRIGDYVYVIGGFNNGQYLASVERATIDNDGSLSPFSDAGVSLVLARSGHTALYVNQQLYVIGGLSISYTPTVERATVDGLGRLRPFVTVTGVSLTTARGGHGSTVIGHNDFVIGGSDSAALGSLESATFSADGDLSTFTPVTGTSLSTKRLGFGNVTIGPWLYVVGGATDVGTDAGAVPGYLTTLERAPLDDAAPSGTFEPLPSVSLAVPRYKLAAFAFGPNLYAIGGTNDVSGALASVEQSTIDARGDLTAPFVVSSDIALAEPRAGAAFLLVPPWLYAIGGHNNTGDLNTVERARVE